MNLKNYLLEKKWRIALLVLIVGLSLFLKFHEVKTGMNDEFPGSDPWAYKIQAEQFVKTGELHTTIFNPLEILYLSGVYSIFGVHDFIPRFIQIIFSFILAILLFHIVKNYFGDDAGYIALLLALIEPNITYYSAHLWTEFWVVFLLTLALYLFATNKNKEKIHWTTYLFLGFIGAIGSFGKLWMIAVTLVLIFFLIIKNFKQAWKTIFYILAVLLIWLPWNTYMTNQAGFPVFINSNSNLNFYLGNNPRGTVVMDSIYDYHYADDTVIEQGICKNLMYNDNDSKQSYYLSKCLGKYTTNYIEQNPGLFIKKISKFTLNYWAYPNLEMYQRTIRTPNTRLTIMWTLWILAIIGFIISLTQIKKHIPLYLIILGIWFSFAITVFLARYKSSVAPFTIIFASLGLYTLIYLLKKNKEKEKPNSKEEQTS